MPRGTTQVVTRGASNDYVSDCAGGRYEVRGTVHVSTRYSSGGGWTNQMVTRGTDVCQYETQIQRTRKFIMKLAVHDLSSHLSPHPYPRCG
ncbi:hypothetical protein Tco_0047516 [Tanacetum coccineum]